MVLGSFINALVWRLHERKNWVSDRSECPHCHHKLAPKDLVPVFSWLALAGKCRYCKKPIPDSPLVELALPLLFVLSYLFWPEPLAGAGLYSFTLWLVFLVGFVALAVYDLKWFLLPDVIVFPLIGLAALQVVGELVFFGGAWGEFFGNLLGAAVISGLFWLIFVISKGKWIGFGDVKLAIVLGLLAGGALPALLVLFVASVLGTLLSLPLVLSGKATRKSHLPFGPMLIAGMIVVMLFGQAMIDWYADLVLVV
ncbi:MAG TPA: prepilin peptidase [Nitrososphaera sp.]|nr:prepilin peptidase [Nitrososphaera sp.]